MKKLSIVLCASLVAVLFGCTSIVNSNGQKSTDADVTVTKNGVTPADILNFDNWKLQLPRFNETKTGVMEVTQDQLKQGYIDNEYFYADPSDKSVVFVAPVDGAKTANTTYSRSELREMLDPSNSAENWTWSGKHILKTREAVVEVPSNGRVVVSQIHGIYPNGDNGPVLVKVEYDYTQKAVVAKLKSSTAPNAADLNYYFYGVDKGQVFDTEIKCVNGVVYVTLETNIDGKKKSETFWHKFLEIDPLWDNYRGYFKAGNYVQDSVKDYDGERSVVKLYSLYRFHSSKVENVPLSALAVDPESLSLGRGIFTKISPLFTPVDCSNKAVGYQVVEGNDYIAIANDGTIVGVKNGRAKVKVYSLENNNIFAYCMIDVVDPKPVEKEELFHQDFNGINTISEVKDLTSDFPGSAKAEILAEGSNKLLKYTDNDPAAPAKVFFNFEPQKDVFTISFRVRIDTVLVKDKGTSKAQSSYLYIDFVGNDQKTIANRLRNNADYLTTGQLVNHRWVLTKSYKECESNPDAAKFELGSWSEITAIIYPNNGTGKANTTDFYINGVKVGAGIANNEKVDAVGQVQIYTGTKDMLDVAIDDVKVYKGIVEPDGGKSISLSTLKIIGAPQTVGVGDSFQVNIETVPSGLNQRCVFSVVQGSNYGAISNDGMFVAKAPGSVTIRAVAIDNPNIFNEWNITVVNKKVPVVSISAGSTNVILEPGETSALSAQVLPSNASEKGLIYSVTKGMESVSVDAGGTVKALKKGTATVLVVSKDNPNAVAEVTVVVANKNKEGDTIFKEDFSAGTLDPSVWSTATSNTNNTVTEIKDGYLLLDDNSTGGQPKAYFSFEPQTDTCTIQFKLMIEKDPNISESKGSSVTIGIGSGNITKTADETFRFKAVPKVESGKITLRRFICSKEEGQSDFYDLPFEYELGRWYTVTLITTPDNGSPRANTTDIYIDGNKINGSYGNKRKSPVVDKMIFQTGTSDTSGFRIDDIEIWSGERVPAKNQ